MNLCSGPTTVARFLSLLVIIIRGGGDFGPQVSYLMVPAYGYANTGVVYMWQTCNSRTI